MNNFPVQYENKTYWISRSVAVSNFIFNKINDKWYILANKRGSGTPNYQGFWNVPCGYLDFDETTKEAACREVFEETGIVVNPSLINLWNYDDNPKSSSQNITFNFFGFLYKNQEVSVSDRGGEINEVEQVKWIPIKDISNYKWAFNHDKIITEMIKKFRL